MSRARQGRRALAGAGLLLLLAAGQAAAELFLVTVPCTPLLLEPGGDLAGGMVTSNTIAAIEDRTDSWVQVRLSGGQTGWLALASGRRIGSEPAARATAGTGKDAAATIPVAPVTQSAAQADLLSGPASSTAAPVATAGPVQNAAAPEHRPAIRPGAAAVAPATTPRTPGTAAAASRPHPVPAGTPVTSPILPAGQTVEYYLRTDATVRTDRNEINMPAGGTLTMVPGDARTRRAQARGDVVVLCRTADGVLLSPGPNGQWQPAIPGRYTLMITGARLRTPALVTVRVSGTAGPAPAANNISPAPVPVPARRPDTSGETAGFDGSTYYRGVRFAPGASLTRLAADWGAPDQQYTRQGNRYYQFGPVTLMAENINPDRVQELILGSGWSVLGVQPGMMLPEVVARWGAPFMPPMPMAAGGWRCGWLRDGFVLSCSLAGPQGPVNELSVARR